MPRHVLELIVIAALGACAAIVSQTHAARDMRYVPPELCCRPPA